MRNYLVSGIFLLTFALAVQAQTAPPVPAVYQDLYTQLSGQISAFSATVHAGWDGTPYPVIHSPALLSANSDMASSLLNADYFAYNVAPEIMEHQALGAQAVTVHINFPVLYEPYYSNPQDYQSYVAFYQQVAQQVHALGMQLIVETSTAAPLAGTNGAIFGPYYQSLSWNDYMTGRAQNAVNIVQQIGPDYMSVITEPDTEASNTTQTNAGTQSGSLQLLQTMLTALQAAGSSTPIGAGVGTWMSSFSTWIQGFAATPVQYIDIHIYPPNQNFLPNALAAADAAHAAGKPIAMSEAWCEKVRDGELSGQIPANLNDIDARYVFSFWSPIDISFLQALVDMSQYKEFLFIAPFWTRYYYAALDYAVYGTITDDTTLQNDASAAAATARTTGLFTPMGLAWENMILPAPDSTAPSVPYIPTSTNSQTAVNLQWTPSTDDIGVAGYYVYRDGDVPIASTSGLQYVDFNVSPGTTYTYTIAAFDASKNVSPLSPPLITSTLSPPDTQAPTIPGNVQGIGVSDKQIQISWAASTDNVAVAGYRIMRGSTPTTLNTIGSSLTTVYLDSNSMYPTSTYYYAVVAYDAVNNVSPPSVVIAVMPLPDTTPPTAPTQLTAAPISPQQINLTWMASTDDIGVAGYKIYRGASASSLNVIGSTPSTSTFYSDLSVNPKQTYYYAVAAFDGAGNNSPKSEAVPASPVPDTQPPSTPTNFAGVAVSMTQINLSWVASDDKVAVAGYKLYRGLSAQVLILMGSTSATTWNDTNNVVPGTTYYYAVSAYDTSLNNSPQSAAIPVTALEDNTSPTVPTRLSAVPVSMTQIDLSWSPSTDNVGVVGYKVYRGLTAQSLVPIASTPGTTWSDSNSIGAGTGYYYAVAAYDASGNNSPETAVIAVTSLPDDSGPTVPTHLAAVAVSMTQINLSWSPSTDNVGIYGYKVYRGITAQSLILMASTSGTTWSDSNSVAAGTTYYYAVSAIDKSGNNSAETAPVAVTSLPDYSAPTTPTKLSGVALSKSQLYLSWSPSTDNVRVAGYKVYRGNTATSLSVIGSTASTTWTDSNGVGAGKTYYYAVAAYDPSGNYSPETDPVSVTSLTQ